MAALAVLARPSPLRVQVGGLVAAGDAVPLATPLELGDAAEDVTILTWTREAVRVTATA